MQDSEHVIRARRRWVELYAATRNASLVCRRCGISAPTLRKWWRRYLTEGEEGLRSRSRRPHHSPGAKLTGEHVGWVIEMRSKRNLGPRRIQAELIRLHALKLSTATIWKVLNRHGMRPSYGAWKNRHGLQAWQERRAAGGGSGSLQDGRLAR